MARNLEGTAGMTGCWLVCLLIFESYGRGVTQRGSTRNLIGVAEWEFLSAAIFDRIRKLTQLHVIWGIKQLLPLTTCLLIILGANILDEIHEINENTYIQYI